MPADIIPMNRAERRRLERAEAKKAPTPQPLPAPPPPPEAQVLDPQDVQTVLLGAAGWSAGHPPFPPGETRDTFRATCDRVAAFLDLELGWPEDASPLALPEVRNSGLILP